ncbi:ABC transporter substrate-binding protein [Clostridia bacterium]|nr:ABC transporter substrate-binding protein [Clostridia bacterium]
MRLSLKKTAWLLLLAMCVSLIAPAAASLASGEKIKLTMVESLTNPERTKVLREIADDYQALHPNITIEIISPPLDGADQKIQQMLVNKNDMDIFEVRDNTVAQFSSNGFIEPLDEYIKDWEDFGTLVDNAKITATLVGDKYYLIPYGFYQRMLYYRADWLEEAGIAVPTTLSELYEAAKAITDPAKGRYGWTLRGISGSAGLVGDMLRAKLGDKVVDLRDPAYDIDGNSIFLRPEAAEVFEYIQKLYQDTSPADSVAWGFQDQCQAFATGITAFLFQDPEVVAICQTDMDEGTWATAPLPVDDVSSQFPISVGYAGWGVPTHSKHKEEAADFIMFLSNPENNVKFCLQYSVIPIHSNAAELSDFFQSGPFAPYVVENNSPENYFLVVGKNRPEDKELGLTMDSEFVQVLTGDAEIEDILTSWADTYTAIH